MDLIELEKRIREAVEKGIVARHDFYESIQLDDEQELGSPAAEVELKAIEQLWQCKLPKSYRIFLSIHNGWKMASGAVDLLSTSQLLDSAVIKEIEDWKNEMKKDGDEVAARSHVIGKSDINATKYLLDPFVTDENGEWRLVEYHHVEESDFPNFLSWLEKSVENYTELAKLDPIEDEEPAPED